MAFWASKLGQTQADLPGSTPHVATPELTGGPFFTLVDCSNIQVTPLIDEGGFIWICGTFRNSFKGVIKLSSEGTEVLRIHIEDQIVATPVLADGRIYLGIDRGVAACYGLERGEQRWTARYAPGCGNDSWSIGYGQETLVLAGKSTEALPWNNCVYGISSSDGSFRWRFEATLLLFFTPCVVHGAVIIQDMQCTVSSVRLSDGTASWSEKFKSQDKKMRATSTGQAVAIKSISLVVAAANRPGKKEWNAQYGGQGCARAFDLWTGKLKWQQDFDLEANTAPAVTKFGPDGSPMVIFSLGATPGGPIKEGAFGDNWQTRIVALAAATGTPLWSHDFEPWLHYGVRGSSIFNILTPTAMTNPVVGGDGTIYVGWCGGWLYTLRATDGEVTSRHDLGIAIQASPVLGPGVLVVASYEMVHIWRPWQQPISTIYEEGQPALADEFTEHFCPFKGGGLVQGHIPYKAPVDLTQPAWSSELTGRRPNEFNYCSPVIDAQGHIYLTSRYDGLRVLRSDGTLRARVHVGCGVTNPALCGDKLYVGTGDGYAVAVSLNTFEIVWSNRYCVQANLDGMCSAVAVEGSLLLCGNLSELKRENRDWFCLNTSDGSVRWRHYVQTVGTLECRPTVVESEDLVIFIDAEGTCLAAHLSDGSKLWAIDKSPYHKSCHIAVNIGPAQAFTTGAFRNAPRWNIPFGGKAFVRSIDLGSGFQRWFKVFEEEECSSPPVVVPKMAPLHTALVVVALGARPERPARLTAHGPDGSNIAGSGWLGRLVAFDCENGATNWSRTMPLLLSNSVPGNVGDDAYLPPAFSNSVVGSDGTLYVAWCGGLLCALESWSGRLLSQYDMGCAAAGSPAIAPGMLCIASAFRLLVWRDYDMEASWRQMAEMEGDPRAASSQSRAPGNVPEVTWGLLPNVAAGRFDPESLRAYQWGEEFLRLEDARRETARHVLQVEQAEEHKAGRGPFSTFKEECHAKLGPPPNPKEGSPVGSPSANAAAPSAGFTPLSRMPPAAAPAPASAPKPAAGGGARPAWLQALGDASLLMDEAAEESPKKQPRWEVIGGAGKGGIVVRRGQDVNSTQLPNRLSTGAMVEEVEVSGDRLRFKKVKGEGPDTGWVSFSFQGKPLLKRI